MNMKPVHFYIGVLIISLSITSLGTVHYSDFQSFNYQNPYLGTLLFVQIIVLAILLGREIYFLLEKSHK